MRPRTIAIIQARMAASRLPGKVLLDLGGQPMLARVVERTRRAQMVDDVVVATTLEPSDEAIVAFCDQRGYLCTRGSLNDVLDRYYQAARQYQAEVVVRITADCPVIDPALIDQAVQAFLNAVVPDEQRSKIQNLKSKIHYDFVANRLPPPWKRTYPIGLDTEVTSFEHLEMAWREATQTYQREHVMPFFYEKALVIDSLSGAPIPPVYPQARFTVLYLHHKPDYGHYRWTVDTPQDLAVLRQVYDRFGGRELFSWQEVLALFQREPQLAEINADVPHKGFLDVDARHLQPAGHEHGATALRSEQPKRRGLRRGGSRRDQS